MDWIPKRTVKIEQGRKAETRVRRTNVVFPVVYKTLFIAFRNNAMAVPIAGGGTQPPEEDDVACCWIMFRRLGNGTASPQPDGLMWTQTTLTFLRNTPLFFQIFDVS